MTIKELRSWAFANNHDDQWWLSVEGVLEEDILSLGKIDEIISRGDRSDIMVLHRSQADTGNPSWVPVEFDIPPTIGTQLHEPLSRKKKDPTETSKDLPVLMFVTLFIPILGLIIGLMRVLSSKAEKVRDGWFLLILSIALIGFSIFYLRFYIFAI